MYQPKTCWSRLRRAFVQKHWCRSVPRVGSNPSSFECGQAIRQSEPEAISSAVDESGSQCTDGRCRRVFGTSLLATCLSRISLMMASNSFEDVVWSNLLLRSASVTIGLFWSTNKPEFLSGSTRTARFPFANSFVMRLRSFFIGVGAVASGPLQSQLIWAWPLLLHISHFHVDRTENLSNLNCWV